MEKIFHRIPFLRFVVALAIGIIIGSKTTILAPLALPLFCISFVFIVLANKFYKYNSRFLFGIGLNICIILLGILLFQEYNRKPEVVLSEKLIAVVLEAPQEKSNSYRSIIQVESSINDDAIELTNERVLAYFEKNKAVQKLKSGDKILLNQAPQLIKNAGNPYEFDYKSFMERRKIFQQIYLPSHAWTKINFDSDFSLNIWAERIREKLLTIYRSQHLNKKELDILSALTLGYKREIDPEVKQVFSEAGAMHVLAVSGLHVGIIFLVINVLLGFLKHRKYGRWFFVIVSILVLWSYAFITGFSPSVQRAAIMFSLIIVGNSAKRQTNIYNTLAASAFILLLLNPNNLFEVGFQLSYSAVFGIVFLQPKLFKMVIVKNRMLKYIWGLLTVSVAAQIATFPLTSYYFGQFPSYFWITNLVVIPAVMILIPLGMALLVLAKIPLLSTLIAFVLNLLTHLVYSILKGIQQLPFSVLDISVSSIQVVFIISTILLMFIFLQTKQKNFLKYALTCIIPIFLFPLVYKTINYNKKEIIVYNNSRNTIIQLISGKKNYVISELELEKDDYALNYVENTCKKGNLNEPQIMHIKEEAKDDFLWSKRGVLLFEGKIIGLNLSAKNFPQNINIDYIINPKSKLEKREQRYRKAIITNKSNFQKNKTDSLQIYYTINEGAFHEKW